MGTQFFFVQIYLFVALVSLLITLIVRYTKQPKLEKANKKLKQKLFWSVALRFVFESYLEFLICVSIGVMNLDWSKTNPAVSYCSIFTLAFVGILAMIFLTSIFYFCKVSQLEDE